MNNDQLEELDEIMEEDEEEVEEEEQETKKSNQQEKPIIQTNNIYHGDCYKLIKEIPDKSIDLIYTDIPYDFVGNGGGAFGVKKRLYELGLHKGACFKVVKNDYGPIILCLSGHKLALGRGLASSVMVEV